MYFSASDSVVPSLSKSSSCILYGVFSLNPPCRILLDTRYFTISNIFLPFHSFLLFPSFSHLFLIPPTTLFSFSLFFVAITTSLPPYFIPSSINFFPFIHYCCFPLLLDACFQFLWQQLFAFLFFLLFFLLLFNIIFLFLLLC